jgi:hypothetical protein
VFWEGKGGAADKHRHSLVVVGVALWLINNYIPMASSIKTTLNIGVVVAVAI